MPSKQQISHKQLAQKRLEALLLEGINSPKKEYSKKEWKSFRQKVLSRDFHN